MLELGAEVRLVGIGVAWPGRASARLVSVDRRAYVVVLARQGTRGDQRRYWLDTGHPVSGSEDTFAIHEADLRKLQDPAPPPKPAPDARREPPK